VNFREKSEIIFAMSNKLRFDTNLDQIDTLQRFNQLMEQQLPPDDVTHFHSASSQEDQVKKVKDYLKRHLQSFYSKPHQGVIDHHWQIILDQAAANIGEDSSAPELFLTFRKVQELYEELNQIIVAIEPEGIFPWDSAELNQNESIRNVLKYILHDIPLDGNIVNSESARYFGYGATHEQLEQMKLEFQVLLTALYNKAISPEGKDHFVLEMLIGQVIAMVAFMSVCKEGDTLEIPTKIEGQWQLVRYKTHLVPLNPPELGDVIEAVYWTALDPDAPPLLVFKASRGTLSWFNDFTPCMGVGGCLWETGKSELETIFGEMRQHRPHQRVQVYGLSLGSALAYRTAQHFPDQVTLHAYGPPGVENPTGVQGIQGESFMDPKDWVSLQGQIPEGPRLIKVIRGSGTNFPLSHLKLYGGEETLLLRVNTAYENARWSRRILTFIHDLFSIPLGLLIGVVILIQAVCHQITNLFMVSIYGEPARAD
jgi:hypothetical protein